MKGLELDVDGDQETVDVDPSAYEHDENISEEQRRKFTLRTDED